MVPTWYHTGITISSQQNVVEVEKSVQFWDNALEDKLKLIEVGIREVKTLKKDVREVQSRNFDPFYTDVIVANITEVVNESTLELGAHIAAELDPEIRCAVTAPRQIHFGLGALIAVPAAD